MLFDNTEVELCISKYTNNHTIAAMLKEKDGNIYAIISKNLNIQPTNERCIFCDINNINGLIKWLIKNKLGKLTGRIESSGFCSYPEFELNEEIFEMYKE